MKTFDLEKAIAKLLVDYTPRPLARAHDIVMLLREKLAAEGEDGILKALKGEQPERVGLEQ